MDDNMNREIFFILLTLLLTPAVSASIGWNGEYWLIGWGGANNPETSQSRAIDLVKFDESNYTFLSIGKPASIGKITWAKDYWLIAVHPAPRPEVAFMKYDNASITKLPVEWMRLNSMVWNEEYFLLGGSVGKRENGWAPVIFKYDGINITELPFPFTEVISPIEPSYISSISWNGDYWLISERIGRSAQPLEEKKRRVAQPVPPIRLVKYDENFTDLGELNFTNINHILWNGKYWLIGGNKIFNGSTEAKLIKYDGKIFTELPPPNVSSISTLAWNGEYWLIGGSSKGVLVKYDGISFTDLKALAGLSDDEYMISTVWNGEYWLIATGMTEPYGRRLLKYDGSSFTDLTSGLGSPIEIRDMVWSGKYWLIEYYVPIQNKAVGQKYVVVKFDGKAFTDLTPQIEAVLQSPPTSPISTSSASPPPYTLLPPLIISTYAKALILHVIILALVLFLIWKTRSRGLIVGAIWGLISPVVLEITGKNWIGFIAALPATVYSEILLLISATCGSFYYSPFIVFPVSIFIGALIGYAVEKLLMKLMRS